jgi:hypothetical protein
MSYYPEFTVGDLINTKEGPGIITAIGPHNEPLTSPWVIYITLNNGKKVVHAAKTTTNPNYDYKITKILPNPLPTDSNLLIKLLAEKSYELNKLGFKDTSLYIQVKNALLLKFNPSLIIPPKTLSQFGNPGGGTFTCLVPTAPKKPGIIPPAYPWSKPSNGIYIALPIDKESEIGKEIEARFIFMGKGSPFSLIKNNLGTNPHISLMLIAVNPDSSINRYLCDINIFKQFANTVKDIFVKNFIQIKPLQLHSIDSTGKGGEYKTMGTFLARKYSDNPQEIQIAYNNFFNDIKNLLLNNNTNINIQSNINASNKPLNTNPSFTHYSLNGNSYPYSEIAISDFYTGTWEPHISLIKYIPPATVDLNDIQKFKDAANHKKPLTPVSYINLWNTTSKKQIITSTGNSLDIDGSISNIFVQFNSLLELVPL